jgi:hypothetical protein
MAWVNRKHLVMRCFYFSLWFEAQFWRGCALRHPIGWQARVLLQNGTIVKSDWFVSMRISITTISFFAEGLFHTRRITP